MTVMKKVEQVYSHDSQSVTVDKEKRHDYKNGGFKLQVTLTTTTIRKIFARLECGHTREQNPHQSLQGSKNLSCWYCDMNANPQRSGESGWFQEKSVENLALAKLHKENLIHLS